MVREGWSPGAVCAFRAVFRPWMRRHVHAIHVTGAPRALRADTPLLLVANHVSWWDGFLLLELRHRLWPHRAQYTVMLESELARVPFLRRIGALGIVPGSTASVRSLLRWLGLRRRRDAAFALALFPQGRIWPTRRRPLGFARGVEAVAAALAPVTVLPVAVHLEPLTAPAPRAFVALGEPMHAERAVPRGALERRVAELLDDLLDFLDRYGEAAPAVWTSCPGTTRW